MIMTVAWCADADLGPGQPLATERRSRR